MTQPSMTMTGMTKRAICVDDPSATPNARSILPFQAMTMAVLCSAAFPTIGIITKPTNVSEMPSCKKEEIHR